MQTNPARPARRSGVAAALAIVALVGCSGGTGASCGSSCGGAFKTQDSNGKPIVFTGSKLPNVASVRITRSGFNFLNATHLNELLTNLNGNAPAIAIPCTEQQIGLKLCVGSIGTEFTSVFIGDNNFDNSCVTGTSPQAHISFKEVTWGLDTTNQIIEAGGTFPEHRHLGREWNLVVSGALRLPSGREVPAGEVLQMEPGSSHTVGATAEEPVVYLAVALEGIAIDDVPLGADDPRA